MKIQLPIMLLRFVTIYALAAVDSWWTGLTPVEQKIPVYVAKYERVNRTIDAAGNAEFGFLALRTQFIGGLQYRFGL
jgi:hypothetical protein